MAAPPRRTSHAAVVRGVHQRRARAVVVLVTRRVGRVHVCTRGDEGREEGAMAARCRHMQRGQPLERGGGGARAARQQQRHLRRA